jgi:hypothetical protein
MTSRAEEMLSKRILAILSEALLLALGSRLGVFIQFLKAYMRCMDTAIGVAKWGLILGGLELTGYTAHFVQLDEQMHHLTLIIATR